MKDKLEYSAFDNFVQPGGISPIQTGDIFIHLQDLIPCAFDKKDPSPSFSIQAENSTPQHGLVAFGEPKGAEVIFNKKIIHATPREHLVKGAKYNKFGNLFTGVRIEDYYSSKKALGKVLVLHCIDEEIAKNIQKFILIYKNLKTPYSVPDSRRPDIHNTIEDLERLEFFRAFRAFVRLNQKNPQPLSKYSAKDKGVPCSGFVSYIVKAAIIAKIFPNGLPNDLMNLYTEIEKERKNQKSGKKLDHVNPELLKLFETNAQAYLEQEANKKFEPEEKDDAQAVSQKKEKFDLYVRELKRPVKKSNIKEFTDNAMDSPLWKAGIYCLDSETDKDFMISYELYQKAYELSPDHPTSILNLSDLSEKFEATQSLESRPFWK
jgi:hypothetical protein